MRGGGDRDPGLPEVRHHAQPALAGQIAHAACLRQPANPPDVGLGHADRALVHQSLVLEARRQPFARRDRDRLLLREPAIAVQVVRPERRLDEEEVEPFPIAQHRERRVRRRGTRTARRRAASTSGPIAARTAASTSVLRSHGSRSPLWAYGPPSVTSAFTARKPAPTARRAQSTIDSAVLVEGRRLRLQRRVGNDAARGPPRPAARGRACPFALPRRSWRAMSSAPIALITAPRRPFIAEPTYSRSQSPLHVERVRADQHLPQPKPHVVRARRLDASAGDPRVDVRLPDAGQPLIGVDLDDDVVLRRARGSRVVGRLYEYVAVDGGDPQWASLRSGQKAGNWSADLPTC